MSKEMLFWLIAFFGGGLIFIHGMMILFGTKSKWIKQTVKWSAILFIIFGWLGLASLNGFDPFNIPFYPMPFAFVIAFVLISTIIVFYLSREPASKIKK